MDGFALTGGQRRRLERQLRDADDVRLYRRSAALLDPDRGRPAAEVARTLGVTRRSIHNWAATYAAEYDPLALADADRSGRPSIWSDDLRTALQDGGADRPTGTATRPSVGRSRSCESTWSGGPAGDRVTRPSAGSCGGWGTCGSDLGTFSTRTPSARKT